jgi:hypothetical protein
VYSDMLAKLYAFSSMVIICVMLGIQYFWLYDIAFGEHKDAGPFGRLSSSRIHLIL